MPFCISMDGCTGWRRHVQSKAQPLLLTFPRNCVVDYGQLPSSAALYPHMSESVGACRTREIGGVRIPWVGADECRENSERI
jgi:hypothetical protein